MTTIEKLQLLADMQKNVKKLKDSKVFTKQNLCDICVPVRDQLNLTDQETLAVANNNATLAEIVGLLQKTPDDVTDERLRAERIAAYQLFAAELTHEFRNELTALLSKINFTLYRLAELREESL